MTAFSTLHSRDEGVRVLEHDLKGQGRPIVGVRETPGSQGLVPFLTLELTELSFDETQCSILPTTLYQVPPPLCLALGQVPTEELRRVEAHLQTLGQTQSPLRVLAQVLVSLGFEVSTEERGLRPFFEELLSRKVLHRGLPTELNVYLYDRPNIDQILWEMDATDKLSQKKGRLSSLWSRATKGDH